MLQQSRKETENYVDQLWKIYKDVLNFCKPDVLKIVQKLGGTEKTKEKLKLITLYSDVLQEFMKKV
jgi:hypothetical protein